MKLTDLTTNYPHVRLATLDDNEDIVNFLKSAPMSFGSMSIRYEFCESIWKFLKYQGSLCHVFLLVDTNLIIGYGVISIRDYFILGNKHKAGYLSDLRISSKAPLKAKTQWKEFISLMFSRINEIDEFKDVPYFYAAVFEKNVRALKLFQSEKFPVSFHPLIRYQAVSILARKPHLLIMPNKKSNNFTIMKATSNDQKELCDFLNSQNSNKFWGEYFDHHHPLDEWKRRAINWDDYDIHDFYLAKNAAGKIVFCTLPWSASNSRKLVIEKISLPYIILGKIFKFIGKKELKLNAPLSNYYLTHFEMSHDLESSQRSEIFTIFLNQLYKTKFQRHYHSIIFCDYYDEALQEVLRNYICINTPAVIYQILPKNDQSRKIEDINQLKKQMTFEAAIV